MELTDARSMSANQPRPTWHIPIGVFFCFGATMASYAAITLLIPGTVLDRGWELNPTAYAQLHSIGRVMGVPFIFLALALLVAAIGWFRRRRWAWKLGTAIIAINLIGDFVNMLRGEWEKGAIGMLVAGLLLTYMMRAEVRSYFA